MAKMPIDATLGEAFSTSRPLGYSKCNKLVDSSSSQATLVTIYGSTLSHSWCLIISVLLNSYNLVPSAHQRIFMFTIYFESLVILKL